MKNLLILFGFLLSVHTVLVAQYTDLAWDQHGVGFAVPDDFIVSTNNSEEFSAGNDYLALSIFVIQDNTIDFDDIAEGVVAAAEAFNFDNISEVGEIELTNLLGYYITGMKDGVEAIFIFLLNPENSTNLAVTIVYTEDSYDDAVSIASSFYSVN